MADDKRHCPADSTGDSFDRWRSVKARAYRWATVPFVIAVFHSFTIRSPLSEKKGTGTAIDWPGGFGKRGGSFGLGRQFFFGECEMTISRSRLVDTDVTRRYHTISRCVRRAMLLSEDGSPGRKDWIDNRLKELDRIFAI